MEKSNYTNSCSMHRQSLTISNTHAHKNNNHFTFPSNPKMMQHTTPPTSHCVPSACHPKCHHCCTMLWPFTFTVFVLLTFIYFSAYGLVKQLQIHKIMQYSTGNYVGMSTEKINGVQS